MSSQIMLQEYFHVLRVFTVQSNSGVANHPQAVDIDDLPFATTGKCYETTAKAPIAIYIFKSISCKTRAF